ncbi:MAG: GNAT family N-acetyltransferase [Tagaea sp.]
MRTVRPATEADVDALAAMGGRFFAFSPYARSVPFDPETVRAVLAEAIGTPHAFVWIAEVDGTIAGALLGVLAPLWFNPDALVATELAWWIDEEHRGGTLALRLHATFEEWADRAGAASVVMSDLVVPGAKSAGPLLERLGYRLVERTHLKEL